MYQVHFGYDRNERERNRYFTTIEAATLACSVYFARTGIVLSIVKVNR